MKAAFIVAIPFTGLGLYNGFRGNRWLRNRIKIFEQFTLKSLLNQDDQDFTLWLQWRREERENPHVVALGHRLMKIPGLKFVFTYSGVCMYDDKYMPEEAQKRLFESLRIALPDLFDYAPDCTEVIHLLQPSDDCYDHRTISSIRKLFAENTMEAVSFVRGYLCNYNTKRVLEYNPKTNPPFAAIRFPRESFFDPGKHMRYIGLKEDTEQYPKGTPLPSHEYLPQCLVTAHIQERGFLVGTHGENISTHFNHPYGGEEVTGVLEAYGLADVDPLALPFSLRKWTMRRLPYKVQRKLRYWLGEKMWAKYYSWIRN